MTNVLIPFSRPVLQRGQPETTNLSTNKSVTVPAGGSDSDSARPERQDMTLSRQRRRQVIAILGTCLVVGVCLVVALRTREPVGHRHPMDCLTSMSDAQSVDATIERGDEIVQAITSYQNLHGRYPRRLDDLVPQHIASIQPPLAGDSAWLYGLHSVRGRVHFHLSFGCGPEPYPCYYYSSADDDGWMPDF